MYVVQAEHDLISHWENVSLKIDVPTQIPFDLALAPQNLSYGHLV